MAVPWMFRPGLVAIFYACHMTLLQGSLQMSYVSKVVWRVVLLLLVVGAPAFAQQRVTPPVEALGFTIGDDYHLATYTQFEAYVRQLDRESPRIALREIGRTAEGRPQLMAIITSPDNHANLDRHRNIARRLALAEGLSDDEARALAREGKAVVWIDGGLHATEVLGAHQLLEWIYQLASRTDAETMRFLDEVIVLAVHANPDGMELVSSWYMRNPNPEERSTGGIPRLYQKYVGHDNNRDFYMTTQPETENMNRIMYREWFPQIVYNHHQTGPAGTVMFAPPFRDYPNHNYDPLLTLGIHMVGGAMHSRFVQEGKPGVTMRSGASYSTWWNGGLRTTPYFHNMIGLLTETIGNPTPVTIPFLPEKQLASNDLPYPIEPQTWHFRQSIEYSITANRAVLDYASRYRETLLYNIYRMGMNSIERGSRDHWTMRPRRVAAVEEAASGSAEVQSPGEFRRRRGVSTEYFDMLRRPEDRDPRGYIIPSDQPDFATATKFVNTLMKNGVQIHRATRAFEVNGTSYPNGSFVVMTAQAFRPHVLDMFEAQDHPDDFAYPGGPPIPPYDNAGWTLAYLMGVEFDRMLDGFEGPFEKLDDFAALSGTVANASGASGFMIDHAYNDAAIVTNRVLAAGGEVRWLTQPFASGGTTFETGTIYVRAGRGFSSAQAIAMANELGVNMHGVRDRPSTTLRIRPIKVALWDRYGGSMPSGWTRWLFERYEFPFEVVYPPDLDNANLEEYDAIVFPTGAIPSGQGDGGFFGGAPRNVPTEFAGRVGSVSTDETIPRLVEYVRNGGTVVAIGSSTRLAEHAGLPVANHLEGVSREEYYIPGSVLRVDLDDTRPVTFGMPDEVDVFFNNSPVFRLTEPDANVRALATFTSPTPLRSGWAWGQERLEGGIAMIEAHLGSGRMFLFGPEVLQRGQPHGTFKLFFNALHLAGVEAQALVP